MPPLVAGGVCRYAMNGSYSGQEVVNILDMHLDSEAGSGGRDGPCFDQAGILINQWSGDVMAHLSSGYTFESVSWIDLDSDEGSVGERTTTDTVSLPVSGAGSWEAHPGNVALRINKNTVARRGQRQGRMYLVGYAEAGTSQAQPNMVTPSTLASLATTLESFLDNINQEEGVLSPDEYTSELVVVHTKLGQFTNFSVVDSLTADPYLGSQVRRLRR